MSQRSIELFVCDKCTSETSVELGGHPNGWICLSLVCSATGYPNAKANLVFCPDCISAPQTEPWLPDLVIAEWASLLTCPSPFREK